MNEVLDLNFPGQRICQVQGISGQCHYWLMRHYSNIGQIHVKK